MCSRSLRPLGLPIYVARVPAAPFSLLPSSLYLDHSHCLVLAPATLAALPSTRAIPDRDVFYVAALAPLHSSFLLFPSHFFLFPSFPETKSRQGTRSPRRLLKSNLLVCYLLNLR